MPRLCRPCVRAPVTERTVFRIGSITKTMTAVAVMQLHEAGRIDLDAPADEYLRAYRLIRRSNRFRQPTIRHLLTHTAGIPDARHFRDLLHFGWGPWDARPPIFSVPFGESLPALGDHYRDGLEVVADPGSAFAYSNPGFATLGQVVEDVSGLPLDRYLRERVFRPVGMVDTDLFRAPPLAARLATGYAFGSTGPRPVPDRDWIGGGGGGVYSTLQDLVRYARGPAPGRRQRARQCPEGGNPGADVRASVPDLTAAPGYRPRLFPDRCRRPPRPEPRRHPARLQRTPRGCAR